VSNQPSVRDLVAQLRREGAIVTSSTPVLAPPLTPKDCQEKLADFMVASINRAVERNKRVFAYMEALDSKGEI
jgi:hypothetical protein